MIFESGVEDRTQQKYLLSTFEITQKETNTEFIVDKTQGNDGGYETNTELEYSPDKEDDGPEVYSPSAKKKKEIVNLTENYDHVTSKIRNTRTPR